jgi:RHS repeat-associated protein
MTSLTYDGNGQLLQTQQSANGAILRTTSATYTLTGKTATVTDANGNALGNLPTRYSYDALDRVTSVTDPMGRVTAYGYDALSRQTAISNPAISANPLLQKSFTPDGLLASLTDANSHSTGFAYDGLDRLTTTTYPLGSTEGFTYDADNNVLTRQTRAGQTVTFTYDTLNRLTTKTPPSPAPVVTYGYDLAGHLTGVSDTSAAIAAAIPPGGSPVQYAAGYSYDATNRPMGVSWTPAPTPAAPTASSVTFGHSYNADNQRIGQSISDNSWVNYPAATASTVSYTANALNQYTAVGSVSPSYDGNGNLTSDGTFTFGCDAENRLTSASGAGNTATYAFDAQGGRKTRTVNGTTTVFVTDADNREVLEYDGGSGAIQRWYAYNLGPNDVLNQTNVTVGTRATLIPDMQGSIIASLDSSSGTLTKVGYLPYGKSGSPGPLGFTGQRVDVEMGGLYYYRSRHYSSAWGRFLQPDSIGYAGGIHLYAYAENDPLNLIDPSGLAPDIPQFSGSTADAGSLASDVGSVAAGVGFGTIASGGGSVDQPVQLAAADESMKPGNKPPLVGGGGGGGLGGGFGGSTSGGRNPWYSPPSGGGAVVPNLPEFVQGGKTTGVLQTPSGNIEFQSGWGGPATAMPPGSRGFDIVTRTHVEGNAAAFMQQQSITNGTLYINNPTICVSCANLLPRMLAPGSTLNVITPNGVVTTFTGVAR